VKRGEGEEEVREVHEGEMEGLEGWEEEEDREGQEEMEGDHQGIQEREVQEVQQGRDAEGLRPRRVSSQKRQPGEGLVCLNAWLWLCGLLQ
jgi:hypothetical protein